MSSQRRLTRQLGPGLALLALVLCACSGPDREALAEWTSEAEAAFKAKRYEAAAEAWARAAALDPEDARPRYNQACALQSAGEGTRARALLTAIDRELSGRVLDEAGRRLLYRTRFRLGSAAAEMGQAALKDPKTRAQALPSLEESAAWFRRAAELGAANEEGFEDEEDTAAANLERVRRLMEPLRKPPEQQQQQQRQEAQDKLDQLQQQQQQAADQNRAESSEPEKARQQQQQLSQQTQEAQSSAEQAGASPQAREALNKAREAQERAEEKLREGRPQEAARDQQEAAEQLARAREALGEPQPKPRQAREKTDEQAAERPLDQEAQEALQRERDQQRRRAAQARQRSRVAPVEKDW